MICAPYYNTEVGRTIELSINFFSFCVKSVKSVTGFNY